MNGGTPENFACARGEQRREGARTCKVAVCCRVNWLVEQQLPLACSRRSLHLPLLLLFLLLLFLPPLLLSLLVLLNRGVTANTVQQTRKDIARWNGVMDACHDSGGSPPDVFIGIYLGFWM